MRRCFVTWVVFVVLSAGVMDGDKKDAPTDSVQPKAVFKETRGFTTGQLLARHASESCTCDGAATNRTAA
jgi:hypothetical protein